MPLLAMLQEAPSGALEALLACFEAPLLRAIKLSAPPPTPAADTADFRARQEGAKEVARGALRVVVAVKGCLAVGAWEGSVAGKRISDVVQGNGMLRELLASVSSGV